MQTILKEVPQASVTEQTKHLVQRKVNLFAKLGERQFLSAKLFGEIQVISQQIDEVDKAIDTLSHIEDMTEQNTGASEPTQPTEVTTEAAQA